MRQIALALVLLTAMLTPAAAQSWKKSSWPSLGFSAEFPGKPTLDTSLLADRPSSTVGVGLKNGYYAVTIASMPEFTAEALADPDMCENILDGAQNESIRQAGTILQSQRPLSLSGRVGREFIAKLAGGEGTVYTRAYLEEGRMVMQIVAVATGTPVKQTKRFLDSFVFLERE